MKTIFLDTSALVKRYALGPGSTEVEAWFDNATTKETPTSRSSCATSHWQKPPPR